MYADSSIVVLSAFVLFVLLSVGVILVLWIAMPFSVFGLKALIKKSVEEQERTNKLLRTLIEEARKREFHKEEEKPAEKREEMQ